MRARRGFTLLEVVISIGVIGTVTALFIAILHTFVITRRSGDQDIALKVAEQKIEVLRATGFATLPAGGSFTDPQLNTLPSATSSLTITTFGASTTKQVVVTISWQEQDYGTSTISLATLITQVGGL